jgi:PAS domain S-box-containing protein
MMVPEPPPAGQTSLRLFLTHLLAQVAEAPDPPDLQAVGTAPGPWHSYLAVPLIGLDKVIGVLCVGHTTSHEYGEPDLRLLSIIGSQLAVYMTTFSLRDQLNQHARMLEAILQQMPAGVMVAEAPSGQLLLSNGQMVRTLGASLPVTTGRADSAQYRVFHPDGQPYRFEEWPLIRAITAGEVVTEEEIDITRPDGTSGTVSANAAPIRNQDGRVVAGVIALHDITERKRAETEANRRRQATVTLMELVRRLHTSLDTDSLLQLLVEGAREVCRSDAAWIVLQDPASEALRFRYWVGCHASGYNRVPIVASGGIGRQVLTARLPFRTDHLAEDPRITHSDAVEQLTRQEGVVALLAVPIRSDTHTEGFLAVGNRTFQSFTAGDEGLLLHLADQATSALLQDRYRAHTQIPQAAPVSHQPRRRGARRTTPEGLPQRLPPLIGTDPQMLELRRLIEVVARTDVPVLLTGETGTGKELVARLIHTRSARATQPFGVIDCPGIPVPLFESEVFGHERGAFTGAEEQRLGRLEVAHGGTLLLDEVGDLPLEVQAKLLRFLEDGQLTRVGGRQNIPVNIRVIAATNRDLEDMVAQGTFRADLFYRLNVIQLHLPPLRERTSDLPLLATHLLEHFCLSHGVAAKVLSSESLARLAAYDWPGNIRELGHVLLRACLLTSGRVITPTDLALGGNGPVPPTRLAAVERQHILTVVRQAQGNISQAARVLGIHRATLYRKLVALGLCPEHLREERSG